MYTSFIYGLVVQSELPLLETLPPHSPPDVVVRYGSLEQVAVEPDQGNQILVSLPWGMKILIQNGCEVTIDVSPNIDPAVVRTHILGAAMAFVLRQRGFLVLHASCVAQGEEAIAFLGGSGWGKSTLASIFHHRGYRLITDDVMAIKVETSTPLAIPSFAEVKLFPDTVAAIGSLAEELPTLQSFSHKQIQRLDQQFATHPTPLKHLYVLRLGEFNDIEPLSRTQAFTELIQHSRAAKTLSDPAFMTQHFHQCSHLAKVVPMSYLKRPRSLEQLPQVVDFIETHQQHAAMHSLH